RHASFFSALPVSQPDGRRAFALLGFATALAGLTIQSCILVDSFVGLGLGLGLMIMKLLSYFTILTNLLVLASYAFALVRPDSRIGSSFGRASVSTGVLLYIVLVSSLYTLLLARFWHPPGWQGAANIILHYATPLLYLAYWTLFVPKQNLPWKLALTWLAYPVAYWIWVLGRGAILGDYPYFFMNPATLGYQRLLLYSTALTGVFYLGGLGVIAWCRRVAKPPHAQEGLK
ncbi:MAG: hypothetical protein JWO82_2708, partial [Akkermansiaceae bacterium]|nr:hypothetical protein [Akkermansiaceae bacterium]